MNPAAAVRGPKYTVTKGKTPVLTAEEARALLDSIETERLKGLRDRALIGVMAYTFARVGAVIRQGKRWWFRLHEQSGKQHEVPAHHKAEAHVDAWKTAAPSKRPSASPPMPRRKDAQEKMAHTGEGSVSLPPFGDNLPLC
jgi:integrase/recombinase XerD